jgi:hypothetical protein
MLLSAVLGVSRSYIKDRQLMESDPDMLGE